MGHTIENLLKAINAENQADGEDHPCCNLCGASMYFDPTLETTPLCHDCGQVAYPALAAEVERLRTENAALSAPIDVKRGDMRMMLNPARRDVVEHHIGNMMERAAAAEAEVERLRTELAKLTTPQPIADLHEDDGEVLLVHWDEHETLGNWCTDCSNSLNFDRSEWTHFYPLARIQPPSAALGQEVGNG